MRSARRPGRRYRSGRTTKSDATAHRRCGSSSVGLRTDRELVAEGVEVLEPAGGVRRSIAGGRGDHRPDELAQAVVLILRLAQIDFDLRFANELHDFFPSLEAVEFFRLGREFDGSALDRAF